VADGFASRGGWLTLCQIGCGFLASSGKDDSELPGIKRRMDASHFRNNAMGQDE
jgi:hypothetical protein